MAQCLLNKNMVKNRDLWDKVDWSIGPMTKNEYEQCVTRFNFDRKKNENCNELLKVVENLTESFLQIMIVLLMFVELPYEGILNHSLFAFTLE